MNKSALMALAAAGTLALAACTPQPIIRADGTVGPAESTGPSAPAGSCNVTNLGWAVGQIATTETLVRIKRYSGASVGRVIAPDTMVTKDFRADRVNVHINSNTERKIQRTTCG